MTKGVPDRLGSAELNAILDKQAERAFAPMAGLMTLTYSILSISHFFLLPQPQAFSMASLAMVTAVSIGVIWKTRSRTIRRFSAHQVIGILAALVLLNIITHMALLEDRLQTTHLAICLVGLGFITLHHVWFVIFISVYLLTWWAVYRQLPSADVSYHYEYLLGISTLIAIFAHFVRHRSETAQILAERRRKELEEKLNQVSRLITLGELAASISHEVNQPLSAISNYATACKLSLSQPNVDTEFAKQQVGQIAKTAIRAGKVIQRLRQIASKTTGKRVRVDLNQTLRDSLEIMSPDLQSQQVSVLMELDDELPTVPADEIQMQQVLINLLQNGVDSLKSASPEAKLTVKTQADEQVVCVTVSDNGPGINFDDRNAVFDAFHTTKTDGIGMGLTICRSIVENHGGRIWCQSENVDNQPQTEFNFCLPRHPEVENV